ncbi:MAG: hypothetical protein R3E12_13030 [Candidatus Eisenbacteria bacterium]
MTVEAPQLRVSILTGFPRMFEGPFLDGMLRVARESGRVEFRIVNLRKLHRRSASVDRRLPLRGWSGDDLEGRAHGAGLESLPPPLREKREVVLLTPQGETLTQARVRRLVETGDVVLMLGRYKGIDERVRSFVTREISIGDYILSGAEPAALVLADAMARLVPGVLGAQESAEGDSFERQILDSSYYTRPEVSGDAGARGLALGTSREDRGGQTEGRPGADLAAAPRFAGECRADEEGRDLASLTRMEWTVGTRQKRRVRRLEIQPGSEPDPAERRDSADGRER